MVNRLIKRAPAATLEQRERWDALRHAPETVQILHDHIADGGTLTDLAQAWGVTVLLITRWLASTPELREIETACSLAQHERWKARIMDELQRVALLDVRELFDTEGRLLPIETWPAAAAAAVVGIEVEETTADGVPQGRVVKVKLADKLKALELIGRQLGMFRHNVQVDVTHSIADKLKAARSRVRVVDETTPIPSGGGEGGISDGGPPHPTPLAQKILLPTTGSIGPMGSGVDKDAL